jgi:hypothetical protein
MLLGDLIMKKFKIQVSLGYLTVECTDIEVEAENLAHAEELALKHAMDDSDKCSWKRCGDFDHNYLIGDSQEL